MSLGRRAFLQFIGGAVGGTLLSPLPWKLADDTAIWSQNWSWRPSPERGEITEVSTVCQFCKGGCGLVARLVNGHRAIMLKGNPAHPVNAGGICPLGSAGLQFLYAPYRIHQPMKQTGTRGDLGGFKPISWDDAIKELVADLKGLRGAGKPNALAGITGQTSSSMFDLWRQFFAGYGSPNLFPMPDSADSQKIASQLMFGREAAVGFSLERATYVLSFGAGLVDGWMAPARMQDIYGNWRTEVPGKAQTEIVQIDSQGSLSASKANKWIAVNPGTEPLMALAIAHVLIRAKLYDAQFVTKHVFGFENWTDASGTEHQGFKKLVLETYGPDKISERIGVAATEIEELAKEFARQKHAVAVWGRGKGDRPECAYHDMAFMALNILIGNFKPGGLVSLVPPIPLSPLPQVKQDEVAAKGIERQRVDLVQKDSRPPVPGNAIHSFLDTIINDRSYPVELLLVHEANPAYALDENSLYLRALAKVDKIVSFSSYMDETALHSDLIIPNHCALERLDDVIGLPASACAYYAVAAPILKPQHDTRHAGDLLLTIAKKCGDAVASGLPWKNYEAFLKDRVKGLAESGLGAVADSADDAAWRLKPGESLKTNYKNAKDLWQKLVSGRCWLDVPANPLKEIATPSGKIELACQVLQLPASASEDILYVPHYTPLPPSGSKKEYPLLLTTYQLLTLSDGYLPNPPFMNKLLPDDLLLKNDLFVKIHPNTAKQHGLENGSKVLLKTPRGEASVRVRVTSSARPGYVFMVKGLGHEAYDEYIKGKGANANSLVEVQLDPLTGIGTIWATRAQLQKV